MSDRSTYTFTFAGLKSEQFPDVLRALSAAFEDDITLGEGDIRVEGTDTIIEIPEIDYDSKIYYADQARAELSKNGIEPNFRMHVAGCYEKNARLVIAKGNDVVVTQADEQGNPLVSLADIAAAAQRPNGIEELLAGLSA